MPRERCGVCGRDEWADALLFCEQDQMWICRRCCVHGGLADPAPRCPHCYGRLAGGSLGPAGDRRISTDTPER